MFENVLKTKMRFFHVCPIGRILNRFSQDMALVDEQLFKVAGVMSIVRYMEYTANMVINILTYILFQHFPIFVSLVLVICVSVPPAILAATVACVLYIFARQYFIPTARYKHLQG